MKKPKVYREESLINWYAFLRMNEMQRFTYINDLLTLYVIICSQQIEFEEKKKIEDLGDKKWLLYWLLRHAVYFGNFYDPESGDPLSEAGPERHPVNPFHPDIFQAMEYSWDLVLKKDLNEEDNKGIQEVVNEIKKYTNIGPKIIF